MLAYVLIGIGVALLVLDLWYPGLGIPSILAFAVLAAGAIMLGSLRVLTPLLAFFAAFAILSTVITIRRVSRAQAARWTGRLLGREALVRTALAPKGFVIVRGERWSARMVDGSAMPGERVWVTGADGFDLEVARRPAGSGVDSVSLPGRRLGGA